MIITVSTTYEPATDLGFLLHKHPGRLQSFPVSVGEAHVFYPEATAARCTAALLVEVDPIELVRGRKGPTGGEAFALGQYVNDRPYAASSMLSMAITKVFRTAMTGRCDARPELADQAIPLQLHVPALPCRGGVDLVERIFAPLGWRVEARSVPLDPELPGWGDSRYVDLRLTGELRLADALNHLYVLLPVLDDAKHYWVSPDEVDKLIRAGGGWLAGHPEKVLITERYLRRRSSLTRAALARLAEADDLAPEVIDNADEPAVVVEPGRAVPLAGLRREAVLAAVRATGARRVGDLGCGEGTLVAALLADGTIDQVVAVDVSARTLEQAARKLKVEEMSDRQRSRLQLFQSSLTYRDARLTGLDAAVLMEVVEHVDPPRLAALERNVFGFAAPGTVIVTTPNVEHNVRYAALPAGTLRHRDHRFEWTRAEFGRWAAQVAGAYGYAVQLTGVGDEDPEVGPPTQLATFTEGGVMTGELRIPELSLVLLVGASGSGKSTFGRTHFRSTEVISSDFCRGLVADDENDQAATKEAFQLLHYIVGLRLAAGRLTVVDATNVQPESRKALVAVAKEHDVLPVAIVLDLPPAVCVERNLSRPDRAFGEPVVRRQRDQLRRGLKGLGREGFRTVHVLRSVEEIDDATIVRTRLFHDRRDDHGPFDVIGDVHGCRVELVSLLTELGYAVEHDEQGRAVGAHHQDRRVIFVGDLVDRGPDTPGVLRLAMGMVRAGDALCVSGNHEAKLLRALDGRQVQVSHGLGETLAQLAEETDAFRAEVRTFVDGLIGHYVFDDKRLVVSHAGLIERYQGRTSARVRSFCLYGDTTGETDEYGLPVRLPWARDYRGAAMVLYGHTPTPEPEWVNNTMCLDTGCVFGGRLTALRYPEREVVSVPAAEVYYEPAKPFLVAPDVGSEREPEVLDLDDVLGTRVVQTSTMPRIGVRTENAAAALEVMSRFAIDPRWLIYLPPTMSPVATSTQAELLEHPAQAFEAYAADGVTQVVCEEKHMGSRAVALVCRDLESARARFGAPGDALGAVWTRTGRSFFGPELTAALVDRIACGGRTGGPVRRAGVALAAARCRAAAVERQGRAAAQGAVRGRRGGSIGVLAGSRVGSGGRHRQRC